MSPLEGPKMVTLQTSALRVAILPEVGGKVGQIECRQTGHRYLVEPVRTYRTLSPSEGWTSGDLSGMDDCLPTIAPCRYPFRPWTGLRLPELGYMVYGAQDVLFENESEILLRHAGAGLPYEVLRRLSFAGSNTLCIDYTLRNLSARPIPFLWSAHPLFAVGPDFRLRLPTGEKRFRVYPGSESWSDWPHFGSVDLSCQWIGRGETLKTFVSGLRQGWCELESEGHLVRLNLETETSPFLGIWFNHSGFPASGKAFRCIALEPCTSPTDDLLELSPDRYPTLPAEGSISWSLSVSCSSL